jgi:hypothetical protein
MRVVAGVRTAVLVAVAGVMAVGEPHRSETTTGEDGEYELRGVPPGEARLGFWAAGYVSEKRTVDTREPTRLDVTLKRGLTLRGEVVKAGTGVPHAFVTARTSVAGASGQSAETDDKGRFVLEGLVPGRYTVTAHASGSGSTKLEDVDAQTAGSLRLVLDKAATAVIHGKVVGLSERDLGTTMISVTGEETRESAHGSVDSSMAFRIEDAPAGRVKVLGVATSPEEGVARSSRTVELTLAPGSETETVVEFTSKAGFGQEVRELDVPRGGTTEAVIELSPADGVGVTVVDARDSRPLEAIVVVRDQARRIIANRHAEADESGALHIPLADGAYLLSTSASGYGTVTLPVTAPTQGLRVGLTPGGTLIIESERELRGRVRLVQPDGEEYVRCWCNGIAEIQLKGRRTSVENVTPGSYTVEIVDSPEATAPRPVVVREGQTSTVAIE